MAKRITYQASFKGKVALEALKENKTLSELAQNFKIHPGQITKWKIQVVQGVAELFEDRRKKKIPSDVGVEVLYAQIGKLQSQLEFLKKKPGWTTLEKRRLVEVNHPTLSVKAQCEALGLSRSSYYYSPITASEETLILMRRIEELHYEHPEYGYRKTHAHLRRDGFAVNEKRIERLWSNMRFISTLPWKNLSKLSPSYPHYPYLLNGLWIGVPNQVHSTDITFLPLAKGFVYLVTVTDWFSRHILSREISNTMTVNFCLVALERALQKARPEYFNMDQGAQFTSNLSFGFEAFDIQGIIKKK